MVSDLACKKLGSRHSEQVESWTHWKINHSSKIHMSGEIPGQSAASTLERQTGTCRDSQLLRAATSTGTRVGQENPDSTGELQEAQRGQLWKLNSSGDPVMRGVGRGPLSLVFSPGSLPGSPREQQRTISSASGKGRGEEINLKHTRALIHLYKVYPQEKLVIQSLSCWGRKKSLTWGKGNTQPQPL